jgi:hypothetical protein
MRDRFFRLTFALVVGACSKPDAPPPSSGAGASASTAATTGTTGTCPATGQWAECSIIYRLDRAGLAPQIDSGAKPAEKELTGKPLVVKLGRTAALELYLYPDSVARAADGKKLDRTHLVDATKQQTMERERTLIESSNVIGLLTSLSSHQRERVSDAIMAGPPQPNKP